MKVFDCSINGVWFAQDIEGNNNINLLCDAVRGMHNIESFDAYFTCAEVFDPVIKAITIA